MRCRPSWLLSSSLPACGAAEPEAASMAVLCCRRHTPGYLGSSRSETSVQLSLLHAFMRFPRSAEAEFATLLALQAVRGGLDLLGLGRARQKETYLWH